MPSGRNGFSRTEDPELDLYLSRVEQLDQERMNSRNLGIHGSRQDYDIGLSPSKYTLDDRNKAQLLLDGLYDSKQYDYYLDADRVSDLAYESAYNYEKTFSPKRSSRTNYRSPKHLSPSRSPGYRDSAFGSLKVDDRYGDRHGGKYVVSEADYELLLKLKRGQYFDLHPTDMSLRPRHMDCSPEHGSSGYGVDGASMAGNTSYFGEVKLSSPSSLYRDEGTLPVRPYSNFRSFPNGNDNAEYDVLTTGGYMSSMETELDNISIPSLIPPTTAATIGSLDIAYSQKNQSSQQQHPEVKVSPSDASKINPEDPSPKLLTGNESTTAEEYIVSLPTTSATNPPSLSDKKVEDTVSSPEPDNIKPNTLKTNDFANGNTNDLKGSSHVSYLESLERSKVTKVSSQWNTAETLAPPWNKNEGALSSALRKNGSPTKLRTNTISNNLKPFRTDPEDVVSSLLKKASPSPRMSPVKFVSRSPLKGREVTETLITSAMKTTGTPTNQSRSAATHITIKPKKREPRQLVEPEEAPDLSDTLRKIQLNKVDVDRRRSPNKQVADDLQIPKLRSAPKEDSKPPQEPISIPELKPVKREPKREASLPEALHAINQLKQAPELSRSPSPVPEALSKITKLSPPKPELKAEPPVPEALLRRSKLSRPPISLKRKVSPPEALLKASNLQKAAPSPEKKESIPEALLQVSKLNKAPSRTK
ncbi:Bsp1p Ecym_2801 [Eremothecium cymbalariae DBVPG|uniref:Uncharacterized protein n=1 Tax=Eremothecium cymbalariae (strain CBS 270.75 / DBVPG 7215 / KCTC 17166 / NRRL Y-17582) TaxID=931890 RepID=G8JQD5_ERECY|nr:Hypothetical protein Ecym_2801 [Eremothecium cymbalariae DBVPG\